MNTMSLLYLAAGFIAGNVSKNHLGSILGKMPVAPKPRPVSKKIEQPFPPSYQYPTPDEVALQPSFNLILYELSGRLER